MKRLVVTIYLMIALIGPSLAQDVAAVGKKVKPKPSSECRPVGTVKVHEALGWKLCCPHDGSASGRTRIRAGNHGRDPRR